MQNNAETFFKSLQGSNDVSGKNIDFSIDTTG